MPAGRAVRHFRKNIKYFADVTIVKIPDCGYSLFLRVGSPACTVKWNGIAASLVIRDCFLLKWPE